MKAELLELSGLLVTGLVVVASTLDGDEAVVTARTRASSEQPPAINPTQATTVAIPAHRDRTTVRRVRTRNLDPAFDTIEHPPHSTDCPFCHELGAAGLSLTPRTSSRWEGVGRLRSCAAVIRDDSILMVEQLNEAGRVVWTLPGGGVEVDETPEAAAIRELAEETGLCGVVRCELVQSPDRIFLVDVDPAAEPVVGDELELFSVAWRPLSEVKDDKQVRLVLSAL